MDSDKASGRLKNLAGLLISLATIVVIFKLTETNLTWDLLTEAQLWLLVLALLFHVLFWLFWAIRLKILCSYLYQTISVRYALETVLASSFLAAITPSSVGGEPVRIKLLADRGASIGSASAIVVAERLLDAIFFLLALSLFIALSGFAARLGLEVGVAFLGLLALCIAFLVLAIKNPHRADHLLDKIYPFLKRLVKAQRAERICTFLKNEVRLFSDASLELTKNSYSRIAPVMLLTGAIWLSEFLVPSAVLLAFRQDPFILYSITSQLIIAIISLLPLTPGSSGIAEGSMFYLYSRFVTAYTLGMLVAVWRGITYFSNLLVGFIITAKVIKVSL
ncbi:MAG: flippase-like domain-containing protein [Methanomicrobia archaeon]|nr:flippase-like domain-containing protein [Methanomicrobia archaeon]